MPDHVHIFIKCRTLTISISKLVQYLKGGSSFRIRKKYSFLKKYKSFWSPSYFCESIGNMSENVIRKYIRNQKINVKSSYKYKFMINNFFKENRYKDFQIKYNIKKPEERIRNGNTNESQSFKSVKQSSKDCS